MSAATTTSLHNLIRALGGPAIEVESFTFEPEHVVADRGIERMTDRVVEVQIAAARCRSIGTPAALAEAERFDANASTFASMAR